MEDESRRAHWENVYTRKSENEVSWYQESPVPSLELIAELATAESAIIDIGGGASRLVDNLIEKGFQDVTVLDLSRSALDAAKTGFRIDPRRSAGSLPTRRVGSRRNPTTSGTTGRRFTSSSKRATVPVTSRALGEP